MRNLAKIAFRNLLRYRRRSLLTASLIALGAMFVLVFVAVTGSFKEAVVGQITDSYLGDLQVHHRGYVASVDSLPLTLNLSATELSQVERVLGEQADVHAYSARLRFGAMFSTFTETTSMRVNGVSPEREFETSPGLLGRVVDGPKDATALETGKVLLPELLARGMGTKVGDTVVLVATNREGSVNGKTFAVGGILESATGPGGRDGYIHLDDARELLRLPDREVNEIAVRVSARDRVDRVAENIETALAGTVGPKGASRFEVHTWRSLTPFANIANLIDVMTFFIKLMLVGIVLISILNVMIMAVYERVREIGTIAAIGTRPSRILALFLVEGLGLGVFGAAIGVSAGLALILVLNLSTLSVSMGQGRYVLVPTIGPLDVVTIAGMVLLVAVLASIQPAYKASRMEPIDALRHV